MSHLRITVDDQILMDSTVGSWSQEPPTITNDLLRGQHNNKPWSMPLLSVLMPVLISNRDASITVTTQGDGGLDLSLRYHT